MKDYEYKISQLVDNELSVEEGQELFLFLSKSDEARKTFAEFMEIKKEANLYYTTKVAELDEPKVVITDVNPKNEKEKKYKIGFHFSAVASIILVFLLLNNFMNEKHLEDKYKNLQTEVITLNEEYSNVLRDHIDLVKLKNKLFLEIEKQQIEKEKITKRIMKVPRVQKRIRRKPQIRTNYNSQSNYLASIPKFIITKDDFLGQQIIGN